MKKWYDSKEKPNDLISTTHEKQRSKTSTNDNHWFLDSWQACVYLERTGVKHVLGAQPFLKYFTVCCKPFLVYKGLLNQLPFTLIFWFIVCLPPNCKYHIDFWGGTFGQVVYTWKKECLVVRYGPSSLYFGSIQSRASRELCCLSLFIWFFFPAGYCIGVVCSIYWIITIILFCIQLV